MKFTSEIYIAWTTFLGSTTRLVTFDFNSVYWDLNRGGSRLFQIEGAQKIMHTQRTSRVPYRRAAKSHAYSRGPIKARPGRSRAIDTLSCYLGITLKQIWYKRGRKKNMFDQNLEGARAYCPPPPFLSASFVIRLLPTKKAHYYAKIHHAPCSVPYIVFPPTL